MNKRLKRKEDRKRRLQGTCVWCNTFQETRLVSCLIFLAVHTLWQITLRYSCRQDPLSPVSSYSSPKNLSHVFTVSDSWTKKTYHMTSVRFTRKRSRKRRMKLEKKLGISFDDIDGQAGCGSCFLLWYFCVFFVDRAFAGLSDLFLDSLFHPWFSWILSFSVDTYSLHLLTFQYRYKPLLSPGGFIAETLVSLLNVFLTFLSFKRKIYDFIWKNKKRRLSLQRQDVQSGCFILLFWLQASSSSSSSHSYEFRSKSRGLNINAFENIMLLECMMRTLLLKHSKVYTKRFERQT